MYYNINLIIFRHTLHSSTIISNISNFKMMKHVIITKVGFNLSIIIYYFLNYSMNGSHVLCQSITESQN